MAIFVPTCSAQPDQRRRDAVCKVDQSTWIQDNFRSMVRSPTNIIRARVLRKGIGHKIHPF